MPPQPAQITRRTVLQALRNMTIGSGLAALGGYGYSTLIEPDWLVVERVTIPINQLPTSIEGLRIVQLSDLHLHPVTQIEHIQAAVNTANTLKPDLVVLTGDFVLRSAESIFELAPVLAQLNATYGVFAILGNHDLWTDAAIVRQGLEEAGLPVLHNQGAALQIGRGSLYVAGLDDGWSGQPDLARALDGVTTDTPTILLMHEPDFADQFAHDPRVSLQLSGHSHGGQIRLPGIGALVLPTYGRKYDHGLYRVQNMWLYTNRGIGVIEPGVRFNCRPEVTEITLVASS